MGSLMAIWLPARCLIIVLMIGLRGIKKAGRLNVSNYLIPLSFEGCARLFSRLFLRGGQIKYSGAILMPDVWALPVFLGRVVDFKKCSHQGCEICLCGVE